MSEESKDYSDFAPVGDGFTSVNTDKNGKLLYNTADAEIGDIVESKQMDSASLSKTDVLICQAGAKLDESLALQVTTPENLADVGHAIKTLAAPIVMQFTDIRILREFIRRHGLFGVRIAHLKNVPEVVVDRLYDQSVWDVRSIDYPVLLDKVQSIADADAAKKRKEEVRRRMDIRERRRVTDESVAGTDVATGFSTTSDYEDEEQFEGSDGS